MKVDKNDLNFTQDVSNSLFAAWLLILCKTYVVCSWIYGSLHNGGLFKPVPVLNFHGKNFREYCRSESD